MAKIETYRSPRPHFSMNPVKFLMWVFLVTVTMLFAAFTSALVVARADSLQNGTWISFHIPSAFLISTAIIVLGSISMQWAYFAAKKNNIEQNRLALGITLVLSIAFLVSQVLGYKALIAGHVYVSGNNDASSFFYVISAIHALHVVGGVFFIFSTLISAYRFRVHSKSLLKINLCATYWHFIGGLWVYLFILLSIFS